MEVITRFLEFFFLVVGMSVIIVLSASLITLIIMYLVKKFNK